MNGLSLIGRRDLLRTGLATLVPAALAGHAMGATVPDGARHAVDRLGWGLNGAMLDAVARSGYERYVEQQLVADPSSAALPAPVRSLLDGQVIGTTPLVDLLREADERRRAWEALPDDDARRAAQLEHQRIVGDLTREVSTRHLLRALHSEQQLLEHMTWFWFNHFNVYQFKANVRLMLGDYEDTAIRGHALGRFRDLLGAVARHPAMLRYLDNDRNVAGRRNENYARELLELHTLGVDGGYTQTDVQEMARVLTGFGIVGDATRPLPAARAAEVERQGAFQFDPRQHDPGEKRVLGQRIAGGGQEELDRVLDIVAAHPATARNLSQRLAVFLLADAPPPALVERMADAFTRSGGRIDETLRVLLLSSDFRSAGPRKFKDPMHYLLSAVRAGCEHRVVLDPAPLLNWLGRMGQGLYDRPSPDGYPLVAAAWTGSGQLGTRFEAARAIGTGLPALYGEEAAAGERLAPPMREALGRLAPARDLAPDTRAALAQARSPREWNALYLSSPEFMYR